MSHRPSLLPFCTPENGCPSMENSSYSETEDEGQLDPPPHLRTLDYAEIGLLSVLLAIGGPLNAFSLYRTVNTCVGSYQPVGGARSTVATPRRRTMFRAAQRTSVMIGRVMWARGGVKSVPRLVTLKVHLTVANCMVLWLYALSQVLWLSTYRWLAGDVLCRVVMFTDVFCFYATSNMVALIAIDRLQVAFHIDRPCSDSSSARYNLPAFLAGSWALALVCSVPQLFLWRLYQPFPHWHQCVSIFTVYKYDLVSGGLSEEDSDQITLLERILVQEKVYNALHLALVFWLPLLVIVVSYVTILLRFHFNINHHRGASSFRKGLAASPGPSPSLSRVVLMGAGDNARFVFNQQRRTQRGRVVESSVVSRLTRAKRTMARKSLWIVLAYVVCWSPYNLLALWRLIDPTFQCQFLEFLYNLIVLCAVLNPIIYGL